MNGSVFFYEAIDVSDDEPSLDLWINIVDTD